MRAAPGAFVMGNYRSGREQQPLRGALHEALVYHRALSGAEVAKHFAANARLAKLPPAPAKPRFVVSPYLQYPTRSSISILWETSVAGTSVVRYGVGALAETKSGPADVTMHEVAARQAAAEHAVPVSGCEQGRRRQGVDRSGADVPDEAVGP